MGFSIKKSPVGSNPLIIPFYVQYWEGEGIIPPPPETDVRITDNGDVRITDDNNVRITD
jgi:hypothetical protein